MDWYRAVDNGNIIDSPFTGKFPGLSSTTIEANEVKYRIAGRII